MIDALTRCRDIVVAAEASALHLIVIDLIGRRPLAVAMASLTHLAGRHMGRVLARYRGAVMTSGAVAGDRGVVEIGGRPGVCGVAVGAGIDTGDMGIGFAHGNGAVVAAHTSADHMGMIDSGRRRPTANRVAALADLCRLEMLLVLAARSGAIMTIGATIRNTGVIISGVPGNGVVAILARSAVDGDMGCRGAGCLNAIVATGASPAHCAVIDVGNAGPTESGVTKLATVVRIDMLRMLAIANGAVVTIRAVAGEIAVIETGMLPIGGCVAVVALLVALNMVGRFAVHPHIVMAILALVGCADKQAVEVAAVASHILMTSSQRKTGGKVVEIAGGGIGHRAQQPHQRQ